MDIIHRFGHGGDVLLGCTGDGRVVDLVCHFLTFWSLFDGDLSIAGSC